MAKLTNALIEFQMTQFLNILISNAEFIFSNNVILFVIKKREYFDKFQQKMISMEKRIKNRNNKYRFFGCRKSRNADKSKK